MTSRNEVQKTGVAIQATVKMIDRVMPNVYDHSPSHDYAQWAPLYNLAHSGIENGLKALILQVKKKHPKVKRNRPRGIIRVCNYLRRLIRQVEEDHPRGHNLRNLFRKLKGIAPQKARSLEDAFTDIVNFYTIDKNRFPHFKSLDTYFKEYGSEKLFETYRYWALENKDMHHIPLFIHRELLAWFGRYCQRGKAFVTSQRVEENVRFGFVRGIEDHINLCVQCRKDCSKPWLKILNEPFSSRTPYSDNLKGIDIQVFNLVDKECLNQVIDVALGCLKESKDPAVQYFIGILGDLPPGSMSPPSDVQIEVDDSGVVKIQNGEILGLVYETLFGRWRAEIFTPESKARIAKTKTDAKYWLLAEGTEMEQVSVDGGPNIPLRAMSSPSPVCGRWNDPRTAWKITFADDSHGLRVGQSLNVRSPSLPLLKFNGTISRINGREVIWGDT